ncbi:MAG: AAA family ATPase [Acetatifactor sp.]|nr:AAA family ATPase [Acetatifactor sp.]
MYRKCESRIEEWIENNKKALLIYGARQVGKTYLIREMLKRKGVSFCEYNLIERTDILSKLKEIDNASDISALLALHSQMPLKEGESVVFLDEIQMYPEIITKIKFLVDEGKYRYILSGSNLGVELKGIQSIPVGYMESFQMFPLDFEEFAFAVGVKESYIAHMKECFLQEKPVDSIVNDKLMQTFYYYLVIGGMPAVVNVYSDSHSLSRICEEQINIVNQYKADFTRYEQENRKLKVVSVYDNIPAQLNKQNRRFSFTMLNKELKFDRYEESFLWLKDAAVAIPTYIVDDVKSPLQMSKETNVFKLFLSDVGLLTGCYPDYVRKELLEMNPEKEINCGALFENYVAEEIYAAGLSPYYFKKQAIGEVDFVIEKDGKVLPVEVKSGKDYKRHAALNHLIENKKLNKAYVLSINNLEKNDIITYLPIYMTGELCKQKTIGLDDLIAPLY